MNRVAACLLAFLAAGALVTLPAPHASAEREVVSDRADDLQPDDVAEADIRKVAASYGHGRLTARVRIPALGERGVLEVYLDPRRGSTYPTIKFLRVRKTGSGVRAGYFHYSDYVGEIHRYDCRVRGRWSRADGLVTVSAPKKCFKPRGLKLHVVAYAKAGSAAGYDHVRGIDLRYN